MTRKAESRRVNDGTKLAFEDPPTATAPILAKAREPEGLEILIEGCWPGEINAAQTCVRVAPGDICEIAGLNGETRRALAAAFLGNHHAGGGRLVINGHRFPEATLGLMPHPVSEAHRVPKPETSSLAPIAATPNTVSVIFEATGVDTPRSAATNRAFWLGYPPEVPIFAKTNEGNLGLHADSSAHPYTANEPHRSPMPFPLFSGLTVADYLLLGREKHRFGWVVREEQEKTAARALGALHSTISPDWLVDDLPPHDRRMLEFARALVEKPNLLVLEAVSKSEVETVRRLAACGLAILCLKGQPGLETRCVRRGYSTFESTVPAFTRIAHRPGKPIFELDEVRLRPNSPLLNLTVSKGEIVGLYGLPGSRRAELLRSIAGVRPYHKGEMVIHGSVLSRRASVRSRLKHGIALLAAADSAETALPTASLADNLTLAHLGRLSRVRPCSVEAQNGSALDWLQKLRVYARSPQTPLWQVSRLDQQKIGLARLVYLEATLLLLEEPTAGLPADEKAVLHTLIGEWASEGKAFLLASNEPAELMGICDTIAVISGGELVATKPATEWTEPEIIEAGAALPSYT